MRSTEGKSSGGSVRAGPARQIGNEGRQRSLCKGEKGQGMFTELQRLPVAGMHRVRGEQ